MFLLFALKQESCTIHPNHWRVKLVRFGKTLTLGGTVMMSSLHVISTAQILHKIYLRPFNFFGTKSRLQRVGNGFNKPGKRTLGGYAAAAST
jgi:hypothetical protein